MSSKLEFGMDMASNQRRRANVASKMDQCRPNTVAELLKTAIEMVVYVPDDDQG